MDMYLTYKNRKEERLDTSYFHEFHCIPPPPYHSDPPTITIEERIRKQNEMSADAKPFYIIWRPNN